MVRASRICSASLISRAALVTAVLLSLVSTSSASAAATGSPPTLPHPPQTADKLRTRSIEQSRRLNEFFTGIRQLPGTNDRSDDARERDVLGVLIFLVLLASSLFFFRVVTRVIHRRHDKWRAQARHMCVRLEELRTALDRLMQLVPDTAGWSDEGWTEGERKAGELARSIERLNTVAPRADRESLSDLVAVLRSLEIVIGNDPKSRARPSRAEGISQRLDDLESATQSLERSMD
jgi:hypothetical protein